MPHLSSSPGTFWASREGAFEAENPKTKLSVPTWHPLSGEDGGGALSTLASSRRCGLALPPGLGGQRGDVKCHWARPAARAGSRGPSRPAPPGRESVDNALCFRSVRGGGGGAFFSGTHCGMLKEETYFLSGVRFYSHRVASLLKVALMEDVGTRPASGRNPGKVERVLKSSETQG